LGERTTANGLERATRRRHSGIDEAWTGFGHISGEADAQNRDQQVAWVTSGNDTTIRCREVSNGAALLDNSSKKEEWRAWGEEGCGANWARVVAL
jgi:hypothetical protein